MQIRPWFIWSVLLLGAHTALGQQPGALDTTFDPGKSVSGSQYPWVTGITLTEDSKIIIYGPFDRFGGLTRYSLALLNTDGSQVEGFTQPGNTWGTRVAIAEPGGGMLLGGLLSYFEGSEPRRGLLRLKPDGSRNTNFTYSMASQVQVVPDVFGLARYSNGSIALIGEFTEMNGLPRELIARIHADGVLDTSFDPGTGIGRWRTNWVEGTTSYVVLGAGPSCLALQDDGQLIVGGGFIAYNGIPRLGILRTSEQGALDLSYNPGSELGFTSVSNGSSGFVKAIAIDRDDRAVISYTIDKVGYVARLLPQGTLDKSFYVSAFTNASVHAMALQKNGRIVLVGNFTNIQNTARNRVARLESDGTVDPTFVCEPGPDAEVYAVAVQSNDDILIGGRFGLIGGYNRLGIARLFGTAELRLRHPTIDADGFRVAFWGAPGKTYILEWADTVSSPAWNTLQTVPGIGTFQELVDTRLTAVQRFYRVSQRSNNP